MCFFVFLLQCADVVFLVLLCVKMAFSALEYVSRVLVQCIHLIGDDVMEEFKNLFPFSLQVFFPLFLKLTL